MIFEGAISVKAAIEGHKRTVNKIYIAEEKLADKKNFRYIVDLAAKEKIEVVVCERKTIDELCTGKQHGGICAEVEKYSQETKLVVSELKDPFLALLEGIEDPYNLGYALRSLYASGCDGVILFQRLWDDSEKVIIRASAGASEFIPLYASRQPDEILRELKYNNVDIICSSRKDASSIYNHDFKPGFVICFGGEKRGLSADIMALSDHNLYIPYQNDFRNSLNGSSAISVVAFEVYRQRNG